MRKNVIIPQNPGRMVNQIFKKSMKVERTNKTGTRTDATQTNSINVMRAMAVRL
jgi:hypothetical protein